MTKLKSIFVALLVNACITAIALSCDSNFKESADSEVSKKTELSIKESNREVGMPAIINWQEKKLMKQIYELRDQENLICYAYLYNRDKGTVGQFIGRCIGYGLPYSTQFSNPMRNLNDGGYNGQSNTVLPQPDPNGLFMPEGLIATWLLLLDKEGNPHPVYIEPEIIVSPFELTE